MFTFKTSSIFLLLSVIFIVSQAKVAYKSLIFKQGSTWQYLTKFGISVGQGLFDIRGRFKKPLERNANMPQSITFTINFYLDTKWDSALEEPTCSNKVQYEIRQEQIEIPLDGNWGSSIVGGLRQKTRPFVWFIAASDCFESIHIANPNYPEIELKIRLTGNDETEFSHEEIGLLSLSAIALLGYILILVYSIYNNYKDIKRKERMDSPILILSIAVVFEFLSLLFQFLHLLDFSYNGEGIKICNGISIILEVASQFFLSLLLIMLSQGWTITNTDVVDVRYYAPLAGTLFVAHLIIAGLTQLSNDAYHKYHDFEGVQGNLLIILRIGMYSYFLLCMKETYHNCRVKAKSFVKEFGIYASGYLLSFPVLLVLSQFCAHYVRHQVISIGSVAVQTIAMCLLLHIFVGRTRYNELSKHNDTILPGGKYD